MKILQPCIQGCFFMYGFTLEMMQAGSFDFGG